MIFFYLHFTARDKNVVSRHKHLEQHGEAGEWVTHTFVQNRHFSKVVFVENQFNIYIFSTNTTFPSLSRGGGLC